MDVARAHKFKTKLKLNIYFFIALKVIGLDKVGHGRILAECTFTSKLMYCLWTTLAFDKDPFVVVTTKPLRSELVADPVQFIRDNIMGKSNEDIAKVPCISYCFFAVAETLKYKNPIIPVHEKQLTGGSTHQNFVFLGGWGVCNWTFINMTVF